MIVFDSGCWQPLRLSADAEAEILRWRVHLRAGPLVIAAAVGRPASTVGKSPAPRRLLTAAQTTA